MRDLTRQRCFNHPGREAAARCPECGRFFCRECVSEHEDRVLCAACLKKLLKPGQVRRHRLAALTRILHFFLGIWLAWIFFHYLGMILLELPTSFHDGTLWREPWW
ncbi:MAG: rhomboid family protein [Thermodesulfobacteriota bacterium]